MLRAEIEIIASTPRELAAKLATIRKKCLVIMKGEELEEQDVVFQDFSATGEYTVTLEKD